MRVLVYCNFLKEVRLGGWGSEGPKGPDITGYRIQDTSLLELTPSVLGGWNTFALLEN